MPADTDGFVTARKETLQLGDTAEAFKQQLVCGLPGCSQFISEKLSMLCSIGH